MIIGALTLRLHLPWVHSLKEKRMIIKSMVVKIREKFNVSVSEVDEQDTHQIAVIGVACVADSTALADSILDHVICFAENRGDAQITDIQREFR